VLAALVGSVQKGSSEPPWRVYYRPTVQGGEAEAQPRSTV
jgi:hypothetical protein